MQRATLRLLRVLRVPAAIACVVLGAAGLADSASAGHLDRGAGHPLDLHDLTGRPLRARVHRGMHAADDAAPPWCGRTLRHDDPAHSTTPGAPTIQLIYAYPRGRPNRFRYYAPILQADVNVITSFVAAQSGGSKTIRFAMGTSCGPQYVSIQVLRLKHRVARYMDSDGSPTVDPGTPLRREIRRATRHEHHHNYLVYVDGLNPIASGDPIWAWGMTDKLIQDDRPGPRNRNNRPGRISAVFGPDRGLPQQVAEGFATDMFAHELFHGLGAVQESAPHSTSGGHCFDGGDVMCYNDGSRRGNLFSYSFCDEIDGVIYEPLDCSKGDYFAATPAPGSYLSTHWNTYDSVFLGSCADPALSRACSG